MSLKNLTFEEYVAENYPGFLGTELITEKSYPDLRNFAKVAKIFGGKAYGNKDYVTMEDLSVGRVKGQVKKFGPGMKANSAVLKFRFDASKKKQKQMLTDLQSRYKQKGIMSFGSTRDLSYNETKGILQIEIGPHGLFNNNIDMVLKKARIIKAMLRDHVGMDYEL